MKKKKMLHTILIVLELVALVHDIYSFGPKLFQYYTINSNVLQLLVSAAILYCLFKNKEIPQFLHVLHLVCAVCLTVTFLIAALVLAPQEGFAYYFLSDVAPINHFLAPVLSVYTFLTDENKVTKAAILAPTAASLLYGFIALYFNAKGVMDGPYFFLRINHEPLKTVVMWFVIIAILCMALSLLYYWLRSRINRAKKA